MSLATLAEPALVDPAVLHLPPGRVGSFVDDVSEIAERLGRPPVPEQRMAIDALTSYDSRGRWLSTSAGLELGRQNGKTSAVGVPIFLWSNLVDPDLYTWTSHRARTHLATFRDLAGTGPRSDAGLINSCDWLSRRVRRVDYENGNEAIEFVNGSRWEFICRSLNVRGTPAKAIAFDEALLLDWVTVGAMTPALATRSLRGDARALFLSSAALKLSALLRSLRRRALAGDPMLTYVGWWARGGWADPGCDTEGCDHAVDAEGCALDRPELRRAANPLLGRLISMSFLDEQRALLEGNPVEFGREHLGWQEEADDEVSKERWAALADPHSKPLPDPVALAVEVAPKGASASVVSAGRRADGLVHVEVLANEPGTAWLPGFLAERRGLNVPVHYRAGRTHTRSVLPALEAVGVQLEPMSLADYAAGCGALDELMESGGIRHLGDPHLAGALERVVRKPGTDRTWVMTWSGASGDVSSAMALPVALQALMASPASSRFVF